MVGVDNLNTRAVDLNSVKRLVPVASVEKRHLKFIPTLFGARPGMADCLAFGSRAVRVCVFCERFD